MINKELDIFGIIKKLFQNIRFVIITSIIIFIIPSFLLINYFSNDDDYIELKIETTTSFNYNVYKINSLINDFYLNRSLTNYLKTIVGYDLGGAEILLDESSTQISEFNI